MTACGVMIPECAYRDRERPPHALRIVQLASEQYPLHMHVVEVRSRSMARIDGPAPEDRALVRRAAILGQTFLPRMLSWVANEGDAVLPEPATWARLKDLFEDAPDGYRRFRRSLLPAVPAAPKDTAGHTPVPRPVPPKAREWRARPSAE